MNETFAPFPPAVRHQLFQTSRGDLCVFLREAWIPLLADLSLLGPLLLISRSEQMSLVSARPDVWFLPVPGTTEVLDPGSGFCLDTDELGAVVAGREGGTDNLSLHFFDREGGVLFKLLLASDADVDGFARLVDRYARDPVAPFPRQAAPPPSREEAVLAEKKKHFQEAWPHFNPRLGGDFLPGGHGVSWWDALCLAGATRASFLTKVGLIKVILSAYQENARLRVTAWHCSLQHEVILVTRRLERCGECLHLLAPSSEAHLFLEADMNFWIGFHGESCAPALHIFSPHGQRRGLIEFEDGPPSSLPRA